MIAWVVLFQILVAGFKLGFLTCGVPCFVGCILSLMSIICLFLIGGGEKSGSSFVPELMILGMGQ